MKIKYYNVPYVYINDDLVYTKDLEKILKTHPEYKNSLYSCVIKEIDIRNSLEDLIREEYLLEYQKDLDEDIFYEDKFNQIVNDLNELISSYTCIECYQGGKLEC